MSPCLPPHEPHQFLLQHHLLDLVPARGQAKRRSGPRESKDARRVRILYGIAYLHVLSQANLCWDWRRGTIDEEHTRRVVHGVLNPTRILEFNKTWSYRETL